MTAKRALLPSLGFLATFGILVTNIVGQGVFLKGRAIACEVGTAGTEFFVWMLAGLIALCGTLSLAELATMMPESGGAYVYVRRAFGEPTAFVLGWTQLLVAMPASIGALASGTAILFNRASGNALDSIPHGTQAFAIVLIAALTAVNCAAVRANGSIAAVSAAMKIATLLGITLAGLALTGRAVGGHVAPAAFVATPCPDVALAVRGGLGGFAAALLGASYAYAGWASITAVAGEVREPTRTLPRAMIGSVLLVISLYAAANAAFVTTLGFEAIRHLSPRASLGIVAAEALFGPVWATISSALLFTFVAATLHVAVLSGSRITFALARDRLLPRVFAHVSRHGVPTGSVIGTSAIAVLLVTVMGFERISDYYVFNSWLLLALVVAGLIVLRRREPAASRPYRVAPYPLVPVVYLGLLAYVLVTTTLTKPVDAAIGLGIALCGIPVYAVIARVRYGRSRTASAPPAGD